MDTIIRYTHNQLLSMIFLTTILFMIITTSALEKEAQFVDSDGTVHKLKAEPYRTNGTSLLTSHLNGSTVETHTIDSKNVHVLKIWLLDINYNWHLAMANTPKSPNSIKPVAYISLHSWRSSYFDMYQSIDMDPGTTVTDLETFSINGQDFLAFSLMSTEDFELRKAYPTTYRSHQQPSSTNKVIQDSKIFRLDIGKGQLGWVLYQTLNTKHASDLLAFSYIYDDRTKMTENYLALLGELDGGEFGLNILKYVGDKFASIYFVPNQEAEELSIDPYHAGTDMLLIVKLTNGTNISYAFDGLKKLQNLPYRRPQSPRQPFINATSQPLASYPPNSGPPQPNQYLPPFSHQLPPIIATQLPQYVAHLQQQRPEAPSISFSSPIVMMHPVVPPQQPLSQPSQPSQPQLHYQPPSQLDDLLGWCTSNINDILKDGFDQTRNIFQILPRVDQHKPIELFGDLIVENDISISHLLSTPKFIESDTGETNPLEQQKLMDPQLTFDELKKAMYKIDQMRNEVEQILVNDNSNQEVNARITFDKIILECHRQAQAPGSGHPDLCPQVGEIRTTFLNGQNISSLPGQASLNGRSMTINNDVRFEHLVLRGDVQINGPLDGVPVDDIVFKSGPPSGPIFGHKIFKAIMSSSHIQADYLNGRPVNRSTVLTTTGDQYIATPIVVNNVILRGGSMQSTQYSSRIDLFNGVNVSQYFDSLILTDSSTTVGVPVEFDRLVINGPTGLSTGSRISSVDIENLASNVLMRHGDQVIVSPMYISEVYVPIGGDIIVNGSLNGIYPFTKSNIVMNSQNATLNNPIIFEQDVYTDNVQVIGSINGIPILKNIYTGREEPAIMYLSGDQDIVGQKVFNHVMLAGPSQITGNINGHLNLTELYHLSQHEGPYHFANVHLDGPIEIKEDSPFVINGLINGVNITDLCGQATTIDNVYNPKKWIEYNELHFEHPVTFDSLRCGSIDGITDMANTFLTKHTDQNVSSHLILNNGMMLNSSLNILSTFNSMSVAPLAGSLSKSMHEVMSGKKEVFGDLYVEDLFVERINDLNSNDIIHTREDQYYVNGSLHIKPQYITGSLQFEDLNVENLLDIGGDLHASYINGINLTDLFYNTLQYDEHQVVYSPLFLNTLHIPEGENLVTKRGINGLNLAAIYSDAVLKDTDQVIYGNKIFDNSVHFDSMYFHRTLDGVTDDDLKINWLLQDTDQVIEGDVEFNNDLIIKKDLHISTGIVNDININQLAQSLVPNEPQSRAYRINGKNGSIRLMNVKLHELAVGGKIQGIDLSNEGVQDIQRNSPILLTGRKHFMNGFVVNGDFSHAIYDVKELCNLTQPPVVLSPLSVQKYPPQQPPTLPLQPPPIYPPKQPVYPPQHHPIQPLIYPPQQPVYPPQHQPIQPPIYPPQQPVYPPQHQPIQPPTYPPQQPVYPPQHQPTQPLIKPPQQPVSQPRQQPIQPPTYPPQQPVYPTQHQPIQPLIYPPQQPVSQPPQQPIQPPNYPPQQPVYPPQHQPIQPPTYPPQQPSYPPQHQPIQPPTYPPQQPSYPPQHQPIQPPIFPPQQPTQPNPSYLPRHRPIYPPQHPPAYIPHQHLSYPLQHLSFAPQPQPRYPLFTVPSTPLTINQSQYYANGSSQQHYPHFIVPHQVLQNASRPANLLTWNNVDPIVWRPIIYGPYHHQQYKTNLVLNLPNLDQDAIFIKEVEFRLVEQSSFGLHYDVMIDGHPDLGPALHASRNPFVDTSTFLLTRSTTSVSGGAPCLTSNQAITLFAAQYVNSSLFKPIAELRETKNPVIVDSVTANRAHYLFVLNRYPYNEILQSDIMIFKWNVSIGQHQIVQTIPLFTPVTDMKVFSAKDSHTNTDRVCLFVTLSQYHSGQIRVLCQVGVDQLFNERNSSSAIPIERVYKFDAIADPASPGGLVMAIVTIPKDKQASNLYILKYSLLHRTSILLIRKVVVQPKSIHFFKDIEFNRNVYATGPHSHVYLSRIYLAIGEGTSSLNDAHAFTNIYELFTIDRYPAFLSLIQTIKGRQVNSIQSVSLENGQALLMLMNTDSVYVYGYSATKDVDCQERFTLRTTVVTRSADSMIVFQDTNGYSRWIDDRLVGRDHYLVLTRENCDQRTFSTTILKSNFDY